VYVSNSDRIRLGLQQYGSDVPDEVVAAAEAALVEQLKPAPKPRARTKKGEFQGDDLATPEVNEAFIAG
jgi:hypothetical protein